MDTEGIFFALGGLLRYFLCGDDLFVFKGYFLIVVQPQGEDNLLISSAGK